VSTALVALALYPLLFARGRDSFPLSPYPMFARAKSSPVMGMHYTLGRTGDDDRVYLRPELVANSEVLQAAAVINAAARRGPTGAMALCKRVAVRVASDRVSRDVQRVQVVAGQHDAVKFLVDGEIGKERTLADCQVLR